jgi:ligand-binding sensor domain-containing protein
MMLALNPGERMSRFLVHKTLVRRLVPGLVLALCVAVTPVLAQAGVWTNFTRGNGLPADVVTAVAVTDSGTVIIAVNEAAGGEQRNISDVYEYDGLRFTSLSDRYAVPPDFNGVSTSCPENPNTPINTIIVSLAPGPDGELWVATSGNGVFRLWPESYEHFTECDGLGKNRTSAVAVQSDGIAWVATLEHPTNGGGGLSRFDGGSWTNAISGGGIALGDVLDLAIATDGTLWMVHASAGGGVTRLEGGSYTNFQRPGGLSANQLWKLDIARNGQVWVTSQLAGVGVFDANGTWLRDFTTADGLVSNTTLGIALGPHGDTWVGTSLGVQRWDGTIWTTYDATSGLVGNQTRDQILDSSGALWVGTSAGLSRYEGSRWLTFGKEHGLADLRVTDLSRGPATELLPDTVTGGVTAGPVYAATTQLPSADPLFDPLGNVVRIKGLTVEEVLDRDGSPLDRQMSAVAALSGGAWVAGHLRVDVDTLFKVQGLGVAGRYAIPIAITPDELISSILVLQDSSVWAGTAERGPPFDDLRESVILRFHQDAWVEVPIPGITPAENLVLVHAQDAAGQVWISTPPDLGAIRVDPADGSHVKYGVAEGLPSDYVVDIAVAGNGDVLIATDAGVARLRGSVIEVLPGEGLLSNNITAIGEDQNGRIWVGTDVGAAYFDGAVWTVYQEVEGLSNDLVLCMLPHAMEPLFGTFQGGLSLFHPDYASPRAAVVSGPPAIIGSRSVAFEFTGGDVNSRNELIDLAWSIDGSPRTSFTKNKTTTLFDLADGPHVLELWARDKALNVSWQAQHFFEVDATPPQPFIASPRFGAAILGDVGVYGDVTDARFGSYLVEFSPEGNERNWQTIDTGDTIPAPGEPLAVWNTEPLPDGEYILRVAVTDTFNLTGYGVVAIIIDNEEPRADVTSPARINNATGGRIYTLNAEVEVYFPPQALDQDRVVTIEEAPEPSTLPPGASRWLGGWRFDPAEFATSKRVTLTFDLAALDSVVQAGGGAPIPDPSPLAAPSSTAELVVFAINPDSSYTFLGGSVDPNLGTITTAIQKLSAFGVFQGLFAATTTGEREIDIQPRAFSPRGNTFDTKAAISFHLNNGGNVQIYVHDRSGRIVRRVFDGSLGPGRNVVDWDGRDGNGSVVPSGVYLVTVKAEGATDVKSVAVVNR